MKGFSQTAVAALFLLFAVQVNGSPYSKFGRTCQDIGCRSTEECKIEEKPCSYAEHKECGTYPTCVKKPNFHETCATKLCGGGQECKTQNGEAVCVNKPDPLGYDSAGVSSINGQRIPNTNNNNNNNYNNHDSVSTNTNPYANANAPPPVDEPGRNYPVSSGTNLGYPPYPSTSNSNNNGYPSSSGTNLGYPPYPTQNRMPMPGQGGIYQQQPPQAGGYHPGSGIYGSHPSYPTNQQYPGHSNYPYQTRNYNSNAHFPRTRGGATSTRTASFAQGNNIVVLAGLVLAIVTKYLS